MHSRGKKVFAREKLFPFGAICIAFANDFVTCNPMYRLGSTDGFECKNRCFL